MQSEKVSSNQGKQAYFINLSSLASTYGKSPTCPPELKRRGKKSGRFPQAGGYHEVLHKDVS